MGRVLAIYFVLITLSVVQMLAQPDSTGAVAGAVLDDETGQPIEYANVFLAQTSIGTATRVDGTFELRDVPPGVYQLVVSHVAYTMMRLEARVVAGERKRYTVRLRQRVMQDEGVEVTGQIPAEWQRLLGLFMRAFMGTSDNADECRLLNPEVLNLHIDEETGRLVATTDSMLRMENRALGYRVDMLIEKYEWDIEEDRGIYQLYPYFTQLAPNAAGEAERWTETRKKTYAGSLKHFLSALQREKLEEEGFSVFAGPLQALREGSRKEVEPGAISVTMTVDPLFVLVTFSGWLKVEYNGEDKSEVSFISLPEGSLVVDRLGNIADFMRVSVVGGWAEYRIADLLPFR